MNLPPGLRLCLVFGLVRSAFANFSTNDLKDAKPGPPTNMSAETGLYDGIFWNDEAHHLLFPHNRAPKYDLLYIKQTEVQMIEVLHNKHQRSLTMWLNRALQLSDLGEHSYHEAMAHIPMFTTLHPPKNVLIVGAGDGGVALRVLMHKSVQKVIQVELDGEVVETCKKYFPKVSASYSDPRHELIISDAIAWSIRHAEIYKNYFDAIIIDSTDDPLVSIWTEHFYAALRTMLRYGGVMQQNIASLEGSVLYSKMWGLFEAGGFSRIKPIFMNTIDYGLYVAYMASGFETPCPGPRPGAAATMRNMNFTWYSKDVHFASLQVPAVWQQRWPEFKAENGGCGDAADPFPKGVSHQDTVGIQSKPVQAETELNPVNETFDVVIIGGGITGIAAASILAHRVDRSTKIAVLEGSSELGGRIEVTDPEKFGGLTVNKGASWIHFAPGNPMLRFAEQIGCETIESLNKNGEWHAKGIGRIPDKTRYKVRDWAKQLSELHADEMREGNIPVGTSAAEVLRELSARLPPAASLEEEAQRHMHMFDDVAQDNTALFGEMSGNHWCDGPVGGQAGSTDYIIKSERGTMCLIDGLVDGLPEGIVSIRTGHVVTSIRSVRGKSLHDLVEVDVDRTNPDGSIEKITVRAKTVLSTVSLGVLQQSVDESKWRGGSEDRGLLRFDPPMPEARIRHWKSLGHGNSLRAAFLYDRVFWNISAHFFNYMLDDQVAEHDSSPPGGYFYGDVPVAEFTNFARFTGEPVLGLEVGKHLAKKFEKLSDEEIGQFFHKEAILKMFGNNFVGDAPVLKAVSVKRFDNDPLIRGGFPFNSVNEETEFPEAAGSNIKQYMASASARWEPLWDDRLYFAGEHTSVVRVGTIEAGYFSGIQAARNILCKLQNDGVNVELEPPIALLRSLGIFGDWYPNTEKSQRCINKIMKKIRQHEQDQKKAKSGNTYICNAPASWFYYFEYYCRTPSKEPDYEGRHCLDMGD